MRLYNANIINLISIFLLFYSCDNKQYKKTFYDSGELKEKRIYVMKDDTSSYKSIIYYKNGNTKSIQNITKSQKEGTSIHYYENKKVQGIAHYNNDKLNGIISIFAKDGVLIRKSLYLNNIQTIFAQYSYAKNADMTKMEYYRVVNGKGKSIGQLVYDKNKQIIDDISFYYEVQSVDTVQINKSIQMNIKVYPNKYKNCHFELLLGEIDNNFNLKDSLNSEKIVSDNGVIPSIDLEIKEYKIGYNLLLGKIYLMQDTMINVNRESKIITDFIFYHDFYAVQN